MVEQSELIIYFPDRIKFLQIGIPVKYASHMVK